MNAFRPLAASIRFRYNCASSAAEHSLADSAARSSVRLFSCIAFLSWKARQRGHAAVEAFGCPPASLAGKAGDSGPARSAQRLAAGRRAAPGLAARVLLDHLRHEVQAVLHGRRRALESFAVDRLGYGVATQTQRNVFNLLD